MKEISRRVVNKGWRDTRVFDGAEPGGFRCFSSISRNREAEEGTGK